MFSPARALLSATAGSDPLPVVPTLSPLYEYGVGPRRAQMMMIAGQPGAMKSTLATFWADRLEIPTLFFSADNAPHTASSRLAAARTGFSVKDVIADLGGPHSGFYEEVIAESNIMFCFDSSPTLDDIADEITAYVEYLDALPELIILDNLMNVETGTESYSGYMTVMKEMHRLARETGAAVWVLHHTTEGEGDPRVCPPRRQVHGKVTQLPEIVLTVAYDPATCEFKVAPVKNRNSPSDASGRTVFSFTAIPERASFAAPVPRIGAWYGN